MRTRSFFYIICESLLDLKKMNEYKKEKNVESKVVSHKFSCHKFRLKLDKLN